MKAQSDLAGDCKRAAEMTAPHAPREVTEWNGLGEMFAKLTDTGSMFDITVSPISETLKQISETFDTLNKPVEVNYSPPAAETL